ncbi:MAG: TatD family hydrolase [Burkholderiaceae bacterium]
MIDTHCHLDFLDDPKAAVLAAESKGVLAVVCPAVSAENLSVVRSLATEVPGVYYCLGLHPCSTNQTTDADLVTLENALLEARDDPRLVGIGEIGLDHFVPSLDRTRMEFLFHAQLRLARDHDLPVVLHVRRAQDQVLKGLRRFGIQQGIAHAFNGSLVQAQAYLKQGMKLGFGGTLTYSRSTRIRALAEALPLSGMVLETDSPDIAPSWLAKGQANAPEHTAGVANTLAELRKTTLEIIDKATTAAAVEALPRLLPTAHPRA